MILFTPLKPTSLFAWLTASLMVAVSLALSPALRAEASSACSTTGATNAYAGGAGTSGDPYLLSTAEQLALLSATSADWSKHFKQTAHITLLDGCIWTPIASGSTFSGTYDGGGFTISGLKTTNHDGARVGLIGVLNTGGTVKNVGAVGVDFLGKYHVGGLVGESYGTIQNSFATGQVVGKVQTGGLVGTFRGGSISNSYAKTSVSYNSLNPNGNNSVEAYRAGGLVGTSYAPAGTISYSWSSGIVETPGAGVTFEIGGVFGSVFSTPAPTFTRVRWDTEVSTQATNPAGTDHVATSTAQMKDLATFTTDGYDIVSGWEQFNFATPSNFWGICSQVNDGYPFLLWEYSTDVCYIAPPPSNSGSGSSGSVYVAPVVVPEAVTPTTVRQATIRKASGDKPARLLGRSLNRDVSFVADSARLSPAAKKTLRQAARLAKASDGKVAVTGFAATSGRGSAYEKSVAQRRALAVARYLRAQGFDDWIYYHGLNSRQGSKFPGQPRRVEIRILK